MTKVNAAPHLLQHSLKVQKLSEMEVHWCHKKGKKKANNGLGFGASLYLELVCLSPANREFRDLGTEKQLWDDKKLRLCLNNIPNAVGITLIKHESYLTLFILFICVLYAIF